MPGTVPLPTVPRPLLSKVDHGVVHGDKRGSRRGASFFLLCASKDFHGGDRRKSGADFTTKSGESVTAFRIREAYRTTAVTQFPLCILPVTELNVLSPLSSLAISFPHATYSMFVPHSAASLPRSHPVPHLPSRAPLTTSIKYANTVSNAEWGTMLAKSKADLRFARPSYRQHTCAPGIINEQANQAGVTEGRKSVTVNATHCCKFSRVACARAPYFMRRPVFLLVVYTGAPVCRESGNMAYLKGRIMSQYKHKR